MTQSLLFVFAYRALGLSPAAVGVVLTLGAVGNVAGAAIASRATARLGTGRSLFLSTTVEGQQASCCRSRSSVPRSSSWPSACSCAAVRIRSGR
jgi:hypothetical protein